jgi:hypothetical protein
LVFDSLKDKKIKPKSLFMIDPRAVSYELKKSGDGLGKLIVKENPKHKNFLSLPEVRLTKNIFSC